MKVRVEAETPPKQGDLFPYFLSRCQKSSLRRDNRVSREAGLLGSVIPQGPVGILLRPDARSSGISLSFFITFPLLVTHSLTYLDK